MLWTNLLLWATSVPMCASVLQPAGGSAMVNSRGDQQDLQCRTQTFEGQLVFQVDASVPSCLEKKS
jgi:hypothetical protein